MLNLTKKRLEILIEGVKYAATSNNPNWENIFQNFVNLLVAQFGESRANLILRFIIKHQNCFSNVDELCDYILDPHSNLVNNNSALTVDQLAQFFPDDNMFKAFQKVIKEHTNT